MDGFVCSGGRFSYRVVFADRVREQRAAPLDGREQRVRQRDDNEVDEASEESFPASDPPSYGSPEVG